MNVKNKTIAPILAAFMLAAIPDTAKAQTNSVGNQNEFEILNQNLATGGAGGIGGAGGTGGTAIIEGIDGGYAALLAVLGASGGGAARAPNLHAEGCGSSDTNAFKILFVSWSNGKTVPAGVEHPLLQEQIHLAAKAALKGELPDLNIKNSILYEVDENGNLKKDDKGLYIVKAEIGDEQAYRANCIYNDFMAYAIKTNLAKVIAIINAKSADWREQLRQDTQVVIEGFKKHCVTQKRITPADHEELCHVPIRDAIERRRLGPPTYDQ